MFGKAFSLPYAMEPVPIFHKKQSPNGQLNPRQASEERLVAAIIELVARCQLPNPASVRTVQRLSVKVRAYLPLHNLVVRPLR